MADWDESEHPRDDAGRFREKAMAEQWATNLVERLTGTKPVELKPWESFTADYGDPWDEMDVEQRPDGSMLRLYSMPKQEVASLGVHPADGDEWGHFYDYTSKGLRNLWNLWNSVDLWLDRSTLGDLEEEDGHYPDGTIAQVRLASGEGFGWLPDGRYRWYLGDGRGSVDNDRAGMNELMRQIEQFADTVETDIYNYEDEEE